MSQFSFKRRRHPTQAMRIVSILSGMILLSQNLVMAATLPTGGSISAGSGAINQTNGQMTIDQASSKMAIDWQSFNVGRDNSVTFNQPSADAVSLNRVLGSEISTVQGAINANGHVFLLNPNGVLFSPTAQVNVGGLVASTLQISNEDFLAGNYTFNGDSAGSIVNQGLLNAADGGYITLIAARIENSGEINAPQGNVLLGAGSKVTLDLGGPVKLRVEEAALDALIEQGGAIRADGGLVYLTAKAANDLSATVINHTGITQAQTLATGENGEIYLLGGMDSDRIEVAGTLDASAPNGDDGGFIETSAAQVQIKDGLHVTTAAALGQTGEWLIDPTDYTIAATGGDITGEQLSANLASTNVTIQSVDGANTSGNGDIFVNDSITWDSNILTLNAQRNIEINRELFGSGTAGLALEYGQGAAAAGNTADYTINAPVNLASTGSFSTKLGSDGAVLDYTILTELGAEGSVTGTDLQGINGNLSGRYVLGADIDAAETAVWNSGAGFLPLGDSFSNAFTGAFDGLGHVVTGLTINRPATNNVGLFGYVGNASSVIRNLGMVGSGITGQNNVGGVVGYSSNGSILRSYSSDSLIIGNDGVGGLVGWKDVGFIKESYTSGTVVGNEIIGGLAGALGDSVRDSYSTSDTAGVLRVGGLIGLTGEMASLYNSWASGEVQATDNTTIFVGGLIGHTVTNSITVSNSYWDTETTGQTTSSGNIGTGRTTAELMQQASYNGWDFDNVWWMSEGNTRPFLRSEYSTSIRNAHQLQLVAIDLTADYTLANDIDMAEITSPSGMWNTSTGFVPLGGVSSSFTGSLDGLGHVITGLYINRPDSDYVGFFGNIYRLPSEPERVETVANVGFVNGTVVGKGSVGSLAGYITEVTIKNAYADLAVSGSSWGTGGLVGTSFLGQVSQSYASGSVHNSADAGNAGGLVGSNQGFITNSYATGGVSGVAGTDVGGLVGGNDGVISNSWSSGEVSGAGSNRGGLIGSASAEMLPGLVENSFWNTETSTTSNGIGVDSRGGTPTVPVGLTTAEMMQLASFDGWDISANGGEQTAWRIYEGQSTPLLRALFKDAVTITISADSREYDGTTILTGGNFTLQEGTDTDLVYLDGTLTYTAESKNAGMRNIIVSGGSLYSTQLGYDLVIVPTTVEITARELGLTGNFTVNDKIYDGTNAAVINENNLDLTNLVAGEDVFLADATAVFANPNAAEDIAVNLDGGTLTGTDITGESSGNYILSFSGSPTTNATITPRPITVTADNLSKIYGNADPTLTWQVTDGNLVGSDTLSGALSRIPGENVGSYTIDASALANGNYLITAKDGALTISQRPITVTADDLSKIYGNADPTLTYQVTAGNLVGDDTLSGALSRTAGENVGSYTIDASELANGNYLITANNGILSITPRPIAITADDLQRLQGEDNPLLTFTFGGDGLVFSDLPETVFSGSLSTDATEASAAGVYAIEQGSLIASNANYSIAGFTPGELNVIAAQTATYDKEAAIHSVYNMPQPLLTPSSDTYALLPESPEDNVANKPNVAPQLQQKAWKDLGINIVNQGIRLPEENRRKK